LWAWVFQPDFAGAVASASDLAPLVLSAAGFQKALTAKRVSYTVLQTHFLLWMKKDKRPSPQSAHGEG
jgi:hypothetical protein